MQKVQAIITAGIISMGLPSVAIAETDFVWPQLTINVGTTAGGIYDTYARLLGNHMGKYLPGEPTVIIQNRPGAGGMNMFNYLFNNAPKDGTELGMSVPGLMQHPIFYGDKSEAQFDPREFNPIGSMASSFSLFCLSPESDLTLEQILAGEPFVAGSPGPGTNAEDFARAVDNLFDVNMTLVSAYPGMAEVTRALQQGEVDAVVGISYDALKTTPGGCNVIAQFAFERSELFPDAPTILELAETDLAKSVFGALMANDVAFRPLYAPPSVPEDRLEAIRDAFVQAMNDPELIAAAKTMDRDVDYRTGDVLVDIIQSFYELDEETLTALRAIFVPAS